MKDYTVGVTELREHYNALKVLKQTIRAQVKAEYEAKIDFEIQSRVEAAELKFANHVAAVKERDNLPVTVIQDHVLRTRSWNRWERIRDMAGIEGEFVRAEAVREEKRRANAPFEWDGVMLTVRKNSQGAEIKPVTFDCSRIRSKTPFLWAWAIDTENPDNTTGRVEAEMEAMRNDKGFHPYVAAEIQKAIDNNVIPAP